MFSEKKYKLVPPDGGWGYLVAAGIIISNVASMGFLPHFGILYKDITEELNMGAQTISTVTAIQAFCISISAFMSSSLLKVFSKRCSMMIGAVFFNIGGFGVIFAKSQLLFILNLIVQAAGTGFLVNISFIVINDYFLVKKVLFMSLTQALPSIANMLTPLIVTWLKEELGYKGSLMILSGVYLQVFVAACLIQPVEWHMKKVEVLEEATEKPLLMTSSKEMSKSIRSDDSHKLTISIETKVKNTSISVVSIDPVKDTEKGNDSEDVQVSSKKRSCLQKIADALNLSVFKNFFIVHTCLSLGFCIFSDTNFLYVLPFALRFQGWNEHAVATAVSLLGFGDIVCRLVIIIFSKFFARIGVRSLYMVGLAVGIISRLAMLWTESVTMVTAFITMAGISHCTITSIPPLILSEVCSLEEFPAAAGAMMLMNGVMFMVLGPAVGAVKEMTNSYKTTFYMLISCLAIVFMFWLIEACYRNNQRKIQKRAKTNRIR